MQNGQTELRLVAGYPKAYMVRREVKFVRSKGHKIRNSHNEFQPRTIKEKCKCKCSTIKRTIKTSSFAFGAALSRSFTRQREWFVQ